MRVPTMERRSFRLRAWIIALVVILVILLMPRGIVGLFAWRERVVVSEPVASRAEAREATG